MNIYPDIYVKSVKDISLEMLGNKGIKGLLIDVDNTLIDYYKNMPDGIVEWFTKVKEAQIKCCILSNSHRKDKVSGVASKVGIPYIYLAKKPFKSGFKKGKEKLGLKVNQIAVIGDQLFTDVIGANRCGMCSILVEQVDKKDMIVTAIKRPLEKYFVKKYLKKQGKEVI